MNAVDELVRRQRLTYLLELMVRRLNESAIEEREKLSTEEREAVDSKYLEWLKSLAEDGQLKKYDTPQNSDS